MITRRHDSLSDRLVTVKVPLKHVLKDPDINMPKIQEMVNGANQIVTHCLFFLKLYLLDSHDKGKTLPIIDQKLVNTTMKILCDSNGGHPNGDTKRPRDALIEFDAAHYRPYRQGESLSHKYMDNVLIYLATSVVTMYENNIKQHYVQYVERYINVMTDKKRQMEDIKRLKVNAKERKRLKSQLCYQLRKIKGDVLTVDGSPLKSDQEFHRFISETRNIVLPDIVVFKQDNIYYDIQVNPQRYLSCMIAMMKEVENKGYSICNVFPLRTGMEPKHIPLDTATIVNLLFRYESHGAKSVAIRKPGALTKNADQIWNYFFFKENRCFKKRGYSFNNMIETDGVSCSILFRRGDLVGKWLGGLSRVKESPLETERYIDELENFSDSLKSKTIVGIDVGRCDLIYCVSDCSPTLKQVEVEHNVKGSGKRGKHTKTGYSKTFRYSQDQRRKETKSKRYAKIILDLKSKAHPISGKTVTEHEAALSKFNKKTLNIDKFKLYLEQKLSLNRQLSSFYGQPIFRKLRLHCYLNLQRSELRMLNHFSDRFGDPEAAVVCFGDYGQKSHLRFKEPTKGKGFRTLFRKYGYETYLVDEYRTSCRCASCYVGACEKYLLRKNPRPYRTGTRLVHGLLSCQKCSNDNLNSVLFVHSEIALDMYPMRFSDWSISVIRLMQSFCWSSANSMRRENDTHRVSALSLDSPLVAGRTKNVSKMAEYF